MNSFSPLAWVVVSLLAILTGVVLARTVWRWKQLPPQPEFVMVEPPPKPRKISMWLDRVTDCLICETEGARVRFDPDIRLIAFFMDREATPRGFLRFCWENDIWPAETTLRDGVDHHGINVFEPNGAARVFFRIVGIDNEQV